MKRLLIIGATFVALSATAVVAYAGTGPVPDVGSHGVSQAQSPDIDSIVTRVLDRIQTMWQWRGQEVVDQVRGRAHEVADPVRDAVHDRDMDVVRDAVDEVRGRAHEVADPVRDAVYDRGRSMDRDGSMSQDDMGGWGRSDR